MQRFSRLKGSAFLMFKLYIRRKIYMMNHFTFIDLFAGIGGFRIAAEKHGGECVFSSEWDPFAVETYRHNHKDTPRGDISAISSAEIPNFDLLCGGFPCQPFSTIGQREGFAHETQGTLFYEIARIIKEKRPKAFLLENVEGLLTHEKGRTFQAIIRTLACSENGIRLMLPHQENLGYHLYWKLLNSKEYGLPQSRNRIYLVGFDSSCFEKDPPSFLFPIPNKELVPIGPYVEEGVLGYSISLHLQKTYLFKKDDGRPQIIGKDSTEQVKTLVSTYHKIQRLTGTFVRDEGSETGIRLLSENECKAIMGFPKDFDFPVSRTQMYRQMGNSVAVNVVEKIVQQIVLTLGFSSSIEEPLNDLKRLPNLQTDPKDTRNDEIVSLPVK
jgi:DNA (cytosine-5)-methyltransferase 1